MRFIEKHAISKAMSRKEVKKATHEDDTLQMGCWNEHPRRVDTDTTKTFKKLRCELSVIRGGLILKGTKMVVPTKRQEGVVALAHQGHQGMVKTKRLIREKVWFPGIDALVEKRVNCQASTHLPETSMEALKITKLPEGLWQHVDIDLWGPFPSGNVSCDRRIQSCFPDVEITIPISLPILRSRNWIRYSVLMAYRKWRNRTMDLHSKTPNSNPLRSKPVSSTGK